MVMVVSYCDVRSRAVAKSMKNLGVIRVMGLGK